MKEALQVAPVFQEEFLIGIFLTAAFFQLFDMRLIVFQGSFIAGPVGTVLSFLIFVRVGVFACIQHGFSVAGILEKGGKKISVVFFQKAGVIVTGRQIQKICVKMPVVIITAGGVQKIDDLPDRTDQFLIRSLFFQGINGVHEIGIQEQIFVRGQIGDDIVMLELPDPFVQKCTGGTDMRTVILSAGAGSFVTVGALGIGDGECVFAVCERCLKAASSARGECTGAVSDDGVCFAACLRAVIITIPGIVLPQIADRRICVNVFLLYSLLAAVFEEAGSSIGRAGVTCEDSETFLLIQGIVPVFFIPHRIALFLYFFTTEKTNRISI